MRNLIFVLCLTLSFSGTAFAADLPEFDIVAICKHTAQFAAGSVIVELGCREQEQGAKEALAISPASDDIINRCARAASTTSQGYSIMQMCVNKELDILTKTQPRGMLPEPKDNTRMLPLLDVDAFCDAMAYYVKGTSPTKAKVECLRQENASLAWFHTDPDFKTADVNACGHLTRNASSYTVLRNCLENRMAGYGAK